MKGKVRLYQDTAYQSFNSKIVKCTIKCKLVVGNTLTLKDEVVSEFTVEDIAKCYPLDSFSLEAGKRLASARASKQAYARAKLELKKYREKVASLFVQLTGGLHRIENLRVTETNHLNNLLEDI